MFDRVLPYLAQIASSYANTVAMWRRMMMVASCDGSIP